MAAISRDDLEPGRHAHPVDQAEAVLWAADLRERAAALMRQQDEWLQQAMWFGRLIPNGDAARWMATAYELLKEATT